MLNSAVQSVFREASAEKVFICGNAALGFTLMQGRTGSQAVARHQNQSKELKTESQALWENGACRRLISLCRLEEESSGRTPWGYAACDLNKLLHETCFMQTSLLHFGDALGTFFWHFGSVLQTWQSWWQTDFLQIKRKKRNACSANYICCLHSAPGLAPGWMKRDVFVNLSINQLDQKVRKVETSQQTPSSPRMCGCAAVRQPASHKTWINPEPLRIQNQTWGLFSVLESTRPALFLFLQGLLEPCGL